MWQIADNYKRKTNTAVAYFVFKVVKSEKEALEEIKLELSR